MSYMEDNSKKRWEEADKWKSFWGKRGKLTPQQKKPFVRNFNVMMKLIAEYFGTYLIKGMRTCEIGAGRGTISDMLNACGAETYCSDLEDRLVHSNHYMELSNILHDTPFKLTKFDLIFTYGLLEHFTEEQRWATMMRMEDMLKPGGMFIHYVVPKKWTNIFEDRSVVRYPCNEWRIEEERDQIGVKYVFPVFKNWLPWECNEFESKGFFIYKRRNNESPSFGDIKK
jgi:2-polyprenyl-3-methyl-5-hydroxy-6-metoxy-1,4-benzoquinol methylase